MKLLVDEDTQSDRLLAMLRAAGHDVLSVAELGKNGAADTEIFGLAQQLKRVVLTHNVADFQVLAEKATHEGLLVIHRGNDFAKNMSREAVVRAISTLEGSGVPIAGQIHSLNHWQHS